MHTAVRLRKVFPPRIHEYYKTIIREFVAEFFIMNFSFFIFKIHNNFNE